MFVFFARAMFHFLVQSSVTLFVTARALARGRNVERNVKKKIPVALAATNLPARKAGRPRSVLE